MITSRHRVVPAAVLAVLAYAASARAQPAQPPAHDYSQWEKNIAAFEAADKAAPPPKQAILFLGSSTIVRWKTLQQDYPKFPIINRGFGGNEIVDSTYYASRIIFPYEPRRIFLRAGGNDLHAGKTPEQVLADFKAFVATVHSKLPETEIIFISLAPAIARWDERDATRKLNALISDYINRTPRVQYVDSYNITLDANGQPRPELFVEDKLHLSDEGYKLLIERVRPYVR